MCSYEKRRSYFLEQHYFDISNEISTRDLKIVSQFDSLPPEGLLEVMEETLEGVEASAESFSGLLSEVQSALSQIEALESTPPFSDTSAPRATYSEKARDLFFACCELVATMREVRLAFYTSK